jgi:hypothetical protein
MADLSEARRRQDALVRLADRLGMDFVAFAFKHRTDAAFHRLAELHLAELELAAELLELMSDSVDRHGDDAAWQRRLAEVTVEREQRRREAGASEESAVQRTEDDPAPGPAPQQAGLTLSKAQFDDQLGRLGRWMVTGELDDPRIARRPTTETAPPAFPRRPR